MNKKGDIASIIFVVVLVGIIGILFLVLNNMNDSIFTELNDAIEADWSGSEADIALDSIHATDNEVWDYAFLGIFLGVLVALCLTAYATRSSPIFYWIYGLISLIVLVVGVIMSNTWQSLAADPEFATTIVRFPITNMLLGTYYPLITLAIIMISMIILFGKPPGQEGFI